MFRETAPQRSIGSGYGAMFARHISQSQLRGAAIRIALLASPISYIFIYIYRRRPVSIPPSERGTSMCRVTHGPMSFQ